jgi:hypothetical protein
MERSRDTTVGRDDVGTALEQFGRQAGRHRTGHLGQGRRHCDLGSRVASEQRLKRAQCLRAREAELLDRIAESLDIGARQGRVVAVTATDLLALRREIDELAGRDDHFFGEPLLQRCFNRQEVRLGRERRDGLARVLRVRGRGSIDLVLRGLRRSHATPEVELPVGKNTRTLQARSVTAHFPATPGEQVDLWPQRRVRELGVLGGNLHARGRDAQVGIAGDGLGHESRQLRITERG